MHSWIPLVYLVTAASLAAMVPAALGQDAKPHPAIVSTQFTYEQAPYPQCHASTIEETSAGKLVAAWFGGTRERHPDVGIWVSHLVDGKWTPSVEVANGVQSDGTRLPTWNPVLFQAPDGPLYLFYKVGPSPSTWWGMYKTSTDGGQTWSDATRLPDGVLGPIKNKPVVLKDGTWISGSSVEGTPLGWRVQFELSSDAGKTWQVVGPIDKGADKPLDAIQPSILTYPDGRLQALCRTRNGVVAQTWSKDNGKTWTPLEATAVVNPNSGTDAVTLKDGRQLLVYNNSAPPPERPTKGVRYPLDVAISTDGVDWKHVLVLDHEPMNAGYAYPAVIQSSDGLVHITYTWDRKRIKHVVLDPGKL